MYEKSFVKISSDIDIRNYKIRTGNNIDSLLNFQIIGAKIFNYPVVNYEHIIFYRVIRIYFLTKVLNFNTVKNVFFKFQFIS